jgi:predicted SAM-dependent methyltransferase
MTLKSYIKCFREGAWYARYQYQRIQRQKPLQRDRDTAYAAYSSRNPQCLHLGAEFFALPKWFNTDLEPRSEGIYYVDATQPFPFPNGSFDFVFSEHMIEHIPFGDGLKMLAECRRILKPGGVLRTATPNLRNILALMTGADGHEAYLRWAVEEFQLPKAPFPKAPGVINNFFRAWGHQFIYDPEMLRKAMEQVGFVEIVQCEVGASRHPILRGLERHGERWSPWVNEFETMVFEGSARGAMPAPAVSMQMDAVGKV